MSAYSDTMRGLFSGVHRKRNEGLETPGNIRIFADIEYGKNGDHPEWQKLDVYLPEGEIKKRPLLINVHGGAWLEGDKEEYKFFCMSLVKERYAVINFSYRLAPEYLFPAAIEDLGKVVEWVCENHEEYGFDIERVYALGDSSGGHTLVIYAALLTNDNSKINIDIGHPDGFSFRAIGLNSTNVFFHTEESIGTTDKHIIENLFGGMPSKEMLKSLDPGNMISGKFPPTYMITGNKDKITGRMIEFKTLLEGRGVDCLCRIYGTDEKPLGHVFFLDIRSEEGREAVEDEIAFFEVYGHEISIQFISE